MGKSKVSCDKKINRNEEIFQSIKGHKIVIRPIIINYKTVYFKKPFPMKRRILKLGSNLKNHFIDSQKAIDYEVNDNLVDKLFLIKEKYSNDKK